MKLPKNFLKNSGIVSILPQYTNSEAMYERFLTATLNDSEEINRAFNNRGLKFIDPEEIEVDNLKYFYDNKRILEVEFYDELCSRIKNKKAKLFCDIISKNWFDGRSLRASKPVTSLMASVENYFIECGKAKNKDEIRMLNNLSNPPRPNFYAEEIQQILLLNKSMLYAHLNEWLKGHSNYLDSSSADLFCRRGIYLDSLFKNDLYFEWTFINSYSLAFSVTEKFSQIGVGKIPAIINTPYSNLENRILFFSPFIKNMPPSQLELGVIPSFCEQHITFQGIFGGINEYLVD